MTPWLEVVHEALLHEDGGTITASGSVLRFGAPPDGTPPACKQLRDAKKCGFFERGPHNKTKGEIKYRAVRRDAGHAPTAEEFVLRVGRVRSVFELGAAIIGEHA